MFGTIAGNSPGSDFAPFSCKIPQRFCFFVVNNQAAVGAKPADFSPVERASHFASSCGPAKSFCHD
jgi:hypothetical protein